MALCAPLILTWAICIPFKPYGSRWWFWRWSPVLRPNGQYSQRLGLSTLEYRLRNRLQKSTGRKYRSRMTTSDPMGPNPHFVTSDSCVDVRFE